MILQLENLSKINCINHVLGFIMFVIEAVLKNEALDVSGNFFDFQLVLGINVEFVEIRKLLRRLGIFYHS